MMPINLSYSSQEKVSCKINFSIKCFAPTFPTFIGASVLGSISDDRFSLCNSTAPLRSLSLESISSSEAEASPEESESEPEPEPEPESEEERMRKIGEAAGALDIRVGQVLKAWRHEEADTLYVEEVDVGEPEPRIICSGLVKYVPLQELQGRNVVVLANLKPRNMRGVKSNGMLLAASDASHENIELLLPPEGSIPGERIWFGSEEEKENQPPPVTPNQVQKKKIWESVQPHLKTDASCNAVLGDRFMRTSLGVVVCKSLKNANVS